jgi:putative nucleotidyltransferase with HDIG domain
MLRRIGLLGGDAATRAALDTLCEKDDCELLDLAAVDNIPPGIAVIAGAGEPDATAEGALHMVRRSENMLYLLAEAIDCREDKAPGSFHRLMQHATRFAEALQLSNSDRTALERASLVHDIGKLKIPNEVLLKISGLTYDEWTLLQQHTVIGADMVRDMDLFQDIEDIVRCHHECFDGDGYPNGIEGEAIPYLARIMKILDVYCAMTSPRIYREGHATHTDAIAHLREEAGKHFDPVLTKAFIAGKVGKTEH